LQIFISDHRKEYSFHLTEQQEWEINSGTMSSVSKSKGYQGKKKIPSITVGQLPENKGIFPSLFEKILP
jgi:hypothetical protein